MIDETPPDPAPAEPSTPAPRHWLAVRHETQYDYESPAELAYHLAHLRPRATEHQTVRGWALEVDPAPDPAPTDADGVFEGIDNYGNWRHTFSHARVHSQLRVVSTFEAGIDVSPALDIDTSPPWEEVAALLRYHAGATRQQAAEFALPSPYAQRAAVLANFALRSHATGRPLLAAALALMEDVHAHLSFVPRSTSVATDALAAFEQREGVCQDFAHVMIGALRSLGLAARYISGYILTEPPPGKPRLVGVDASHAWVAVWCPHNGWVALDPTNKLVVGTDHVTLAWGRDYGDVAPLRGVIRGGGQTEPQVAVTVQPVQA